ncbi:MAG TPA: FAD-dependent oxidoreductase [Caulobacteraceae bacterium]
MVSSTRRQVMEGGLSAGAASVAKPLAGAATYDVAVVGAGVFGTWTAWRLQQAGKRVALIDAWGPAHARASSGGESRLTRTAYGADEVYSRWAWESLKDWKRLSAEAGLPLFHETGVLFFFGREEPYVRQTLEVHRRLKLPTETLDRAEMARRFPQIDFSGVEIGIYEPRLGALMARRAVQTLKERFVRGGGTYLQAAVLPPPEGAALTAIETTAGSVAAGQFCFACGPWLPKLFPGLLAGRIFPTRQEVFFFAPKAGDRRFEPGRLPGWADFNEGDIFYGFPDLEARGFKIAHDQHGPPMDPDTGDRTPSPAALAEARAYMRRRFPALAKRPLNEARVCQYENSSNGDFLIDRHPRWSNVVLLGAGSGHGFKHGPAVGSAAAGLLLDPSRPAEARFSLATKAVRQDRAVH